jgi:hypothetical protein
MTWQVRGLQLRVNRGTTVATGTPYARVAIHSGRPFTAEIMIVGHYYPDRGGFDPR